MDLKYLKNTRNYSKTIVGKPYDGIESPIYLIPRQRGGPSYKKHNLEGVKADEVQYCAISKGFGMQDVSSFTLGPIVGEGLNLVNAAYSKSISIMHIVGGGKTDLKRKDFWSPGKVQRQILIATRKADKKLLSTIKIADETIMIVDGEEWDIHEWLATHECLWLDEWQKWSHSVALCGMGDFHWTDQSPVVAYRHHEQYLAFVDWKKQCYVAPSMKYLGSSTTYQFLEKLFKSKIPLGLVHPKAITDSTEKPITREALRELFESETEMCCQPMVIAAKLLGLSV
jgi:hypothetical protein